MTDSDSAQLKLVLTQLADEAGTFEPPPFETWHSTNTPRRGHRTGLLAGLAATVVAALAVVLAVSQNGHDHSASPPPEVRSSATHNSISPQLPNDDYPVVPGHVALYLDLSRAAAPADGSPVSASVHLINGLGHPYVVPNACNAWLGVGLTVGGQPFDLVNGGVACAGRTIPTGSTVIPVQISTTYGWCSQIRSQATATVPYCEGSGHDQMPNLPAGHYTISIATSGVPAPITPRKLDFTLTPR
jgi:hypothetical protein